MIDIVTVFELQQDFAKLTKMLRKQNSMSQSGLAKDLNLSRATI